MYGQTGTAAGVTSTVAGVAALPNTGGNTLLTIVSLAAVTIGVLAIAAQIVVGLYRKKAVQSV